MESAVKSEAERDTAGVGDSTEEVEPAVKLEVETDAELSGDDTNEDEPEVKFEVETDTDAAEDDMNEEDWPAVKFEPVETDSEVAEQWPTTGGERYSADEPAMKTKVKMEIDAAEESSLYWPNWGMLAEQHTLGSGKYSMTSETAGSQRRKQPARSAAVFSTGSRGLLKPEAADQDTGLDLRTTHPVQHNQQPAGDCSAPSAHTKGRYAKRMRACQQCGAVFGETSHLKRHMLIHTGEKPHHCQQCGTAFRTAQHLKAHTLIHTGEKPHVCQQCGATFARLGHLKDHMLIHTGDKPHKCVLCAAAFGKFGKLKRHMLIHTGEKPHKCLMCGAGFIESRNLKDHMLIHTGEKPHKCVQCGAAFRHTVSLKKHMLVHAEEQGTT